MTGTGSHCSDLMELNHIQSLQEIATQNLPEAMINSARREYKSVAAFAEDLRRPLIKLFQPLPAEVHIKHFIAGLGSLGMALGLGAIALGRRQLS